MLLDGELAERQAHPAVVAVVDGVPRLLEGVEDALLIGLGYALAVVADAEHEAAVLLPGPEVDVAAAPRVLDGVGHEVREHTAQQLRVAVDPLRLRAHEEPEVAVFGPARDVAQRLLRQVREAGDGRW